MANPTVEIAGVDRTLKTLVDSVSIHRSISNRSTMRCTLIEVEGTYTPQAGEPIVIEQDGDKKFAGLIEDFEQEFIEGVDSSMRYSVSAVDFTRLLDWRCYEGSFENQSFYSIIEAMWAAKLSGDGVTLTGVINPGPTITTRIQDGLRPITEWFRKLATETGYLFYIDADKVLHFGPLQTSPSNPCPFVITWTSRNWRNMKIRRRMGDYRNRQYVRTEYTTTGLLTEQYTGDGSTRDFFINAGGGAFNGAPTATVDTGGGPVAVAVGRLGFDGPPGPFDWYYDFEGWGFHNFAPDPALGVGDILEISYRVRFNNKTVAEDAAEIAARAAIQGDSGVIEAIHEDRYIDRKASLDARAVALLRQYGSIPIEIDFETSTEIEPLSADVEPGQDLDVDLTGGPSSINDNLLIESVESQWIATGNTDIWQYRISATSQEPSSLRPAQSKEPVVAVVERIAEAVRIGPDPDTILAESPEAPTTVKWTRTIVDTADPLEVGDDLSNHFPVEVEEGEQVELLRFEATLKDAAPVSPSVQGFEFEIVRSDDGAATWAVVFTGKFEAGDKHIEGDTFDIYTLNPDDLIGYNATYADGTAAVLTVVLCGRVVTA